MSLIWILSALLSFLKLVVLVESRNPSTNTLSSGFNFSFLRVASKILLKANQIKYENKCTITWVLGDNVSMLPGSEYLHIIAKRAPPFTSPYIYLRYSIQCTVVLYATSILHSSYKSLDENWLKLIPGTVFNSYHFYMETQVPSNEFWTLPLVRRLFNVAVLVRRNDFAWDVLVPHRFRLRPRYLTVAQLLHGTTVKLSSSKGIFWNKWQDLQGSFINVAVPPDYTQELFDSYRREDATLFPVIQVAEAVRFLNATPKVLPVRVTWRFGTKLPNGTWDGFMGKVMYDEVDMTYPFFPHDEQFLAVFVSKPVMITQVKFFTPLPKKTGITLKFLSAPFDKRIWAGLLLSIAANTIILYVLKTGLLARRTNTWSRWKICRYMIKLSTYFARILVDQPMPNGALLTSIRARFLLVSWLLAAIVMGNHYKSVVVSVLVKPIYEYPPRTVPELIESGYQINVPLYESLTKGNLPWEKNLQKPMVDFGMDFRGCLQTLLKGDNVCLFISHWLYLQAPFDLIDVSGRRLFLESKNSLHFLFDSFYISQRNPQLKGALDRVSNVIVEGGLTIKWVDDIFHQRLVGSLRRKRALLAGRVPHSYDKADLTLLRFPLLIFLVCCVSGCLCHAAQNLHYRMQKKRKNKAARSVSSVSSISSIVVHVSTKYAGCGDSNGRRAWRRARRVKVAHVKFWGQQ